MRTADSQILCATQHNRFLHNLLQARSWLPAQLAGQLDRALRRADMEAFLAAEARPLVATPQLLLAVLWMGLVASVVTSLVQTWAQARMPAVHAAVVFALEPVFTALFAALTLGERLSPREWWGGALVLLGIVVSELRIRR